MTMMRVDDLTSYHRNPRRGNVAVIAESLATLGQYRPIVVNRGTLTGRSFEVLAGNQTLAAARGLAWPQIDVYLIDVSEEDAARIVVVDNRANDLAVYDDSELRALLDSMPTLVATGWTDEERAALAERVDAGIPTGLREPGPVAAESVWDRLPEAETVDETLPRPYDDDTIEDLAFDYWRSRGFPYPECPRYEALQQVNQLAQTRTDALLHSRTARYVAEPYHRHRWSVVVQGKRSAASAFEDDDMLRHALRLAREQAGYIGEGSLRSKMRLVRGSQVPGTIRPGIALAFARKYAPPHGVWLDTSVGFGGALTAFAASNLSRYVGIDPSTLTDAGNRALARDLGIEERVTLIRKAAEDVAVDEIGSGTCDYAFTSPPYFSKEKYSDEDTQSWVRYTEADAWREGFLAPTLRLQFECLRPQAVSLVNISDVTIGSTTYPLGAWTKDVAGQAGFEFVGFEELPVSRVPGQGEKQAPSEPILVFRKP